METDRSLLRVSTFRYTLQYRRRRFLELRSLQREAMGQRRRRRRSGGSEFLHPSRLQVAAVVPVRQTDVFPPRALPAPRRRGRTVTLADPHLLAHARHHHRAEDEEAAVNVQPAESLGEEDEAQDQRHGLAGGREDHGRDAAEPLHERHVARYADVAEDGVRPEVQGERPVAGDDPQKPRQGAVRERRGRHADEDEEIAVHGHLQPRAAVHEESLLGVGEDGVGHDAPAHQQKARGMEFERVEGVVRHREQHEPRAYGKGAEVLVGSESLRVDDGCDEHGWNKLAGTEHCPKRWSGRKKRRCVEMMVRQGGE